MQRLQGCSQQMPTKKNRVHGNQKVLKMERSSSDEYMFYHVGNRSVDPVQVQGWINGKELSMEVDTDAALSIIWKKTRKQYFQNKNYNS